MTDGIRVREHAGRDLPAVAYRYLQDDDEGAEYGITEPEGPPRIATVWDPAYVSDAAPTISTTRAARVIDLDAHPGDGTYALVKDDARMALFDIAGSACSCTGEGAHVEFHEAADAGEYRAALERLPRFLDRVRPGLAQFQAGMDPFEDDPVGGIDGMTKTFLAWRDRFVLRELRARDIPAVVNLAGGYLEDVTPRLHVQTMRIAARAMARCEPRARGSMTCHDVRRKR